MLNFKVAWLAAVIGLGATVGGASPVSNGAEGSVNMPAEQLRFYQNKDGLTFANAWGDPATGPHSNYIKLTGNTASPLHVHTSNYYGVVISGTVSNERRAQPDQALRPGSYWFQKGGEPHVTKCLSTADCLIFVTSHGAFDIRPIPDPAPPGAPAEQPR